MDVTLGVRLADGSKPSIVTGIDDYSRFCVCATVVARATAKPVCDALLGAMTTHGVPEEILTDNGKVFTNRFGRGDSLVLFDRICQQNGIKHRLTKPHSPTTTGKVERFHKTLKREFLDGKVFAASPRPKRASTPGLSTTTPNETIRASGNVPPATRFALGRREPFEPPNPPARRMCPHCPELRPPSPHQRLVCLLKFNYHVGRYLAGQNVDVILKDGLFEVFS